jgi:cold shock CspA family protein
VIDREDDRDRPAERSAPKRKGPIVNRRGPSEISRAIQMRDHLAGGRPASTTGRRQSDGSPSVARGTVVRMDKAKGYGFIVDSAGEQRFFHRSVVLDGGFDALQEQQPVDFEPFNDDRGARAQKVRPAGATARDTAARPQAKPAKLSPRTPKAPAWKSDLSPFRNGSGAPSPGARRPKF